MHRHDRSPRPPGTVTERGVRMRAFLAADQRFLGLDDRQADPDESEIIVLPVPFERTSSFGTGSAAGPEAILRASREVELYDTELGCEPWAAAGGIATLEPLTLEPGDDGSAVMESVDRVVSYWRERRKVVVTIAGEHTGVVGAIRAHMRSSAEVTVLQLDAHSDLRESYMGDRWNHACTMARVLEFHDDIVQVGIRSESLEDRSLAYSRGVRVFRASKILDDSDRGVDWIAAVLDACAERVYVTFDCDVIDPAVLPATGTPEPGGLSWRQINALLDRLCRARRVIGFDVSELAPLHGCNHPQFTIAKLIARFTGWIGAAASRPSIRSAIADDGDGSR